MMNTKHAEMKKQAINDIIDYLENGYSGYYCDLHNEVFNTGYYVVGTHIAKSELRQYDVFDAIELVQNYEKDNFGELYTDCSDPEKLINMVYYIVGDDVITDMYSKIDEFRENWDNEATDDINIEIAEKIKAWV